MTGELSPLASLRTAPVNYFLLGGISGSVFLFSEVVSLSVAPSLFGAATVCGVIFLVLMFWMWRVRLDLTQDSINYRSFLVTRSLPLQEIEDVRLDVGFKTNRPFQRIVISTRSGFPKKEIVFNAGFFDVGQTRTWENSAKAKLKQN